MSTRTRGRPPRQATVPVLLIAAPQGRRPERTALEPLDAVNRVALLGPDALAELAELAEAMLDRLELAR